MRRCCVSPCSSLSRNISISLAASPMAFFMVWLSMLSALADASTSRCSSTWGRGAVRYAQGEAPHGRLLRPPREVFEGGEGGGRGAWDPKVWLPKMAQPDFLNGEFFPTMVTLVWRRGGSGEGLPPPLILWCTF